MTSTPASLMREEADKNDRNQTKRLTRYGSLRTKMPGRVFALPARVREEEKRRRYTRTAQLDLYYCAGGWRALAEAAVLSWLCCRIMIDCFEPISRHTCIGDSKLSRVRGGAEGKGGLEDWRRVPRCIMESSGVWGSHHLLTICS